MATVQREQLQRRRGVRATACSGTRRGAGRPSRSPSTTGRQQHRRDPADPHGQPPAATFFDIGITRAPAARCGDRGGWLCWATQLVAPDMSRLTAAQQAARWTPRATAGEHRRQSSCFFRRVRGVNSTTLDLAGPQHGGLELVGRHLDWEARGSADPSGWTDHQPGRAGRHQTHTVILFHNQRAVTGDGGGLPSIIASTATWIHVRRPGRERQPSTDAGRHLAGRCGRRSLGGRHAAGLRAGYRRRAVRVTATSAGFRGLPAHPRGTRSGPAAVSWDGQRVDLFVAGTDRACGTPPRPRRPGAATTFEPWQHLGGALTTAPAVASTAPRPAPGQGAGDGRRSWSRAWDGTTWTTWGALGGLAIAARRSTCSGRHRPRDGRGTDGVVWQREVAADGGPMAGWASTGEHTTFARAASATAGWAQGTSGRRLQRGSRGPADLGGRHGPRHRRCRDVGEARGGGEHVDLDAGPGRRRALWVNVAASGGSAVLAARGRGPRLTARRPPTSAEPCGRSLL